MIPVSRIGDSIQPEACGSGTWGAYTLAQGSGNVNVNGIPVSRLGDSSTVHCCGPVCHTSSVVQSSVTVFVNGLGIARIGDVLGDGGVIIQGSGNVFAG